MTCGDFILLFALKICACRCQKICALLTVPIQYGSSVLDFFLASHQIFFAHQKFFISICPALSQAVDQILKRS